MQFNQTKVAILVNEDDVTSVQRVLVDNNLSFLVVDDPDSNAILQRVVYENDEIFYDSSAEEWDDSGCVN